MTPINSTTDITSDNVKNFSDKELQIAQQEIARREIAGILTLEHITEENVDKIYNGFMDILESSKKTDWTTDVSSFIANLNKSNHKKAIRLLWRVFSSMSNDDLIDCYNKQSTERYFSWPRLDASLIQNNAFSFCPTGVKWFSKVLNNVLIKPDSKTSSYDITLTERALAYATYYVKNKKSFE